MKFFKTKPIFSFKEDLENPIYLTGRLCLHSERTSFTNLKFEFEKEDKSWEPHFRFVKEDLRIWDSNFRLDYMGAAEFEYGAYGKAVSNLFGNLIQNIDKFQFIKLTVVGKPYDVYEIPEGKKRRKLVQRPAREIDFYLIAPEVYTDRILNQFCNTEKSLPMKSGWNNTSLFPEMGLFYDPKRERDYSYGKEYDSWIGFRVPFLLTVHKDVFDDIVMSIHNKTKKNIFVADIGKSYMKG